MRQLLGATRTINSTISLIVPTISFITRQLLGATRTINSTISLIVAKRANSHANSAAQYLILYLIVGTMKLNN